MYVESLKYFLMCCGMLKGLLGCVKREPDVIIATVAWLNYEQRG